MIFVNKFLFLLHSVYHKTKFAEALFCGALKSEHATATLFSRPGRLALQKKLSPNELPKGTFQNRFNGFFPLRGYPPPSTPLTENHFAKKTIAEKGGYPPPLNGKLPKIFLKKWVKKD